MPEISVIIPTYGMPDRLSDTISSVLKQTYTDFELIIVDDNDPDSENRYFTTDIVEKAAQSDKRVIYICHEKNKNGSAARNTGIRSARGKYISLLDSDDEYMPQRLEKCLEAIKRADESDYRCVYTGCEYRINNKKYRTMQNVRTGNFLLDYLAMDFNLFTGSNIFMAKDVVDELKGFDESFIRQQDVEFMIRYFSKYRIIGIPDVLVIKNLDGKNKPNAEKYEAIKKHFLSTFEPQISNFSASEQKRIYGANYRQVAEQYLLSGNRKKYTYYYNLVKQNDAYNMRCRIRRFVYSLRAIKSRM